jgi:DNA-binding response OmpR family regulator
MLVGRVEILRLRRKIEADPASPAFIVTQRGACCSIDALVDGVR